VSAPAVGGLSGSSIASKWCRGARIHPATVSQAHFSRSPARPAGRPAATVAAQAALQPLCKPKHASIPDAKYKDCLQAGKSVAMVHQIKSIAEVVAEYRAERS